MTDYCSILLNPSTKSDILAACIQAAAAITAGHEQAFATKVAGALSVVTGGLAFAGGRYAYLAAVRQVRLSEEENANKRRRYLDYLLSSVRKSMYEVVFYLDMYEAAPGLLANQVSKLGLLPSTSALMEAVSPENWQTLVNAGNVDLSDNGFLTTAEGLKSQWGRIIDEAKGPPYSDALLQMSKDSVKSGTESILQDLRELRSTISGF